MADCGTQVFEDQEDITSFNEIETGFGKGKTGFDASRSRFDEGKTGLNEVKTGFSNTIIIQMDPDVQEVWDSARKINCEWVEHTQKHVAFQPFEVVINVFAQFPCYAKVDQPLALQFISQVYI